jgi:hypothetical protein
MAKSRLYPNLFDGHHQVSSLPESNISLPKIKICQKKSFVPVNVFISIGKHAKINQYDATDNGIRYCKQFDAS